MGFIQVLKKQVVQDHGIPRNIIHNRETWFVASYTEEILVLIKAPLPIIPKDGQIKPLASNVQELPTRRLKRLVTSHQVNPSDHILSQSRSPSMNRHRYTLRLKKWIYITLCGYNEESKRTYKSGQPYDLCHKARSTIWSTCIGQQSLINLEIKFMSNPPTFTEDTLLGN